MSTTATKPKPREVKLPCCPNCGHVGLQVDGVFTGKVGSYCVGPMGDRHRKTKMQKQAFREVVS